MNNSTLTIFEYTSRDINHGNFCLTKKEINYLERFNNSLKKTKNINNDIVSFTYINGEAVKIKASSYVGVIKVGKKSIQIVPKLAKDNKEDNGHFERSIRNLIFLLSYTKKLKIKETEFASLKINKDSIFEILIYLFASNLLQVIRRNVNRQYILKEDNLGFIKGKLQINNHLKTNIAAGHKFYLEFDEFCEDNLINQIIKYTIKLLIRVTVSSNNLKLLQELDFIFSDISNQLIKLSDFSKVSLSRLNSEYEPILNLCKIFIGQGSLDINPGKLSTFSFIFDMNVLFEEFIGEFIKTNFRNDYLNITLQKPIRWFVEDKVVEEKSLGRVFQLRPDIQLFKTDKNTPSLIIDTKYKILESINKKGGVSQSDLYQMSAYSKKFNCKNIILLYPQVNQEKKDVKFIIDESTNVFIKTIDLSNDLRVGSNIIKLKEDLKSILAVHC